MSTDKTLDDIVAEIHGSAERARECEDFVLAHDFDNIADRIEAATRRMEERHKRELDAAMLNKDFLDSTKYLAEVATRTRASQQGLDEQKAGNVAKLRKALSGATSVLECVRGAFSDWIGNVRKSDVSEAIDNARAALAEPPRNCDVGTENEQRARFVAFCKDMICGNCPYWGHGYELTYKCYSRWSQAPYEQQKEETEQ
jgi:hypothetical protein